LLAKGLPQRRLLSQASNLRVRDVPDLPCSLSNLSVESQKLLGQQETIIIKPASPRSQVCQQGNSDTNQLLVVLQIMHEIRYRVSRVFVRSRARVSQSLCANIKIQERMNPRDMYKLPAKD